MAIYNGCVMSSPRESRMLDYAAAPRGLRAIRWRRFIVPMLILAAVGIASTRIPRILRYFKAVADERSAAAACLNYSLPASEVVFDESVKRESVGFYPAGQPDSQKIVYRSSRVGPATPTPQSGEEWFLLRIPWSWEAMLDARQHQYDDGDRCKSGLRPTRPIVDEAGVRSYAGRGHVLLFMHERRTPAGGRRLVTLFFAAPAFICNLPRPFSAHVSKVDSDGRFGRNEPGWYGQLACTGFAPPPDKLICLYAGQPDPVDASRFTIAVKIGDADAIIDGKLGDDDSIALSLRAGQ